MPHFRKLKVRQVTKYVILDGEEWPSDKEYVELGERQGWLKLYKIIRTEIGECTYQYRYLE